MRQSWREAWVGGTAEEGEDYLLFIQYVIVNLFYIKVLFISFLNVFQPGAAAAGASSLSQVCRVSPLPTTRAIRPLWSPCGQNT